MAQQNQAPQRPSRDEIEAWINEGGQAVMPNGARISNLMELERYLPSERPAVQFMVQAPATQVDDNPPADTSFGPQTSASSDEGAEENAEGADPHDLDAVGGVTPNADPDNSTSRRGRRP